MYEYRLTTSDLNSSESWVKVPKAETHQIIPGSQLLVFFDEDDNEIAVVRQWNEVRNLADES